MNADRIRTWLLSAITLMLCTVLVVAETAADEKPADKADVAKTLSPVEIDKAILAEVKANFSTMKNLQYLCDVIGPRLTGTPKLERANNWTADVMKNIGLTNVQLEPWEIPVAWERGTASLKMIEPNGGKSFVVASAGWSPSTQGKVEGPVVYLDVKTRDDLAKYKGKLKNAIIIRSAPQNIAPVTDLRYLSSAAPRRQPPPPPPMNEAKKPDEAKPEEKKPEEAKKEETAQPPAQPPRRGFGEAQALQRAIAEFLKEEGAAVVLRDSAKPHGLLVMSGSWPNTDRGGNTGEPIPTLFISHEDYGMLYRLATMEGTTTPRAEVEINNKFIPGPVTVYNTVGDLVGSEKPDEFVIVGAHLDSWDLGTGATDNGTGSCTVLEVARTLVAMAKQGIRPKRTIRFVLYSGEEQGLHGSKQYVRRHKDEMDKISGVLVHDTGTGFVKGFGLQGRTAVQKVLEPELETLKTVDNWVGLNLRNMGGTDHLSYEAVGVPGFACDQDDDEYRLTHHTESDTFDHAKEPNLIQGAQVLAVAAMRIANLPEMLPRERPARGGNRGPGEQPMPESAKPEEKKPEEKKGG